MTRCCHHIQFSKCLITQATAYLFLRKIESNNTTISYQCLFENIYPTNN